MAWKFERVAGPFRATEGPIWTGDAVRFTEIQEHQVLEYDPVTGETSVYIDPTAGAVGLHEGRDGELYACEAEGHRIAALTPDEPASVVVDEAGAVVGAVVSDDTVVGDGVPVADSSLGDASASVGESVATDTVEVGE